MNDYVYHDGFGHLVRVDVVRAREMVEQGRDVFELVPVEPGDLDEVASRERGSLDALI